MVFGLIWFTEEGKLHLECTFLGFCTCVALWFIERGMCGFALVLLYGLLNEECVVLRLCWFMVYRMRNIAFGVCLSLVFLLVYGL